MKTDTADQHWNDEWAAIAPESKWRIPEADVTRWAATLAPGARVLDLGAGVGRHALYLAEQGFEVTALDAAAEGLAAIRAAGKVSTVEARMDDLPFETGAFDHVLSWNVIYHGDEDVLLRTIAEIRRVLRPGGSYLGTMLSKRRLPHEQAKYPGREISRNAWVFDAPDTDKIHPHYFCSAAELLALFSGFECLWLEDREHQTPGSWHWHLKMERL
ncbi:class I SAM-dependent methyltransferase [Tritonibacter horizontis]|uniref:Sarcosine/dimethylglycine N-methyltransferase n=1 Tax=Tritonibacter horizontis TaxID=1768241 RepID=A0A132C378_9RHOB|nr:class I SAM-dependent methyltransferase [Tritonibacter horizontis]KUP95068.1 sarcosine/dimethylglycine N-methyltransferase [Tritonibacter horizontis]